MNYLVTLVYLRCLLARADWQAYLICSFTVGKSCLYLAHYTQLYKLSNGICTTLNKYYRHLKIFDF